MDLKEIKLVIRWRWHVDLAQTAFPHRVVWEAPRMLRPDPPDLYRRDSSAHNNTKQRHLKAFVKIGEDHERVKEVGADREVEG